MPGIVLLKWSVLRHFRGFLGVKPSLQACLGAILEQFTTGLKIGRFSEAFSNRSL